MTQSEINQFKNALARKEAELLKSLRNRDGLIIEQSADVLETVLSAQARQLTADGLTRYSDLLTKVRAAMERLDNGEFGVCTRCEEEISPKRLQALPWATLCIDCQEKADRKRPAIQ